MIQGKPVEEVLTALQFLPKKSAKVLWKLVKAASSNAQNNLDLDPKTLVVKRVDVGR